VKLFFDAITRAIPVLFLVSGFLCYAGLSLMYVHGGGTSLAVWLLVLSGLAAALAAAAHLRQQLTGFGTRALAWRLSVVVGVALSVIGVFEANVFAHLHECRLDLTEAKTHTLKPQTLACLGRLKDKVSITALYAGPPPDAVKDLLEEFEREGHGLLSQEIVDPLQRIGYAAQFGPRIDGSERRVVVRTSQVGDRPGRREEINCKESALSEDRLTAALIKLTGGQKKAYFVTGHQEYDTENKKDGGYSQLKEALERQNITVSTVILATVNQVPVDCNVLVVGGARREFSKDEKARLVEFQARGGSVLFLLESASRGQPGETSAAREGVSTAREGVNPAFNDIFSAWGLQVGNDVVVDLANHIGQDVGCPAVSTYPPHDKIVNSLGITFYIRPRSLTFAKQCDSQVYFAPLVQTMGGESSWAESDRGLFVKYQPGQDLPGPVAIAGVFLRPPAKGAKSQVGAKMIVIGNASFVTNEFVDRYSNLDLVVNAVAWLSEAEPLLSSGIKNDPPKLAVTSKDLQRAQVILGLTPLGVMSLGVVVWWRRHRKQA